MSFKPPCSTEHNTVLLTRETLLLALNDLAARLFRAFGTTIRLTVHGGAVMVLHVLSRSATRDVDYIHRSFVEDCKRCGIDEIHATKKLRACITSTAHAFGLGEDWMNAHADVALPMAYDFYGRPYDPIYYSATTPPNVTTNTIYSSQGLTLVGVTWSWAVALKLVRFQKDDPADIAAILRLGERQGGVVWTRATLEGWLFNMCRPMGYEAYQQWQIDMMRERMRHAIRLAQIYCS